MENPLSSSGNARQAHEPSSAPPRTNAVIVVTGGASGIGAGTVRLLADRGAHVVIADRDMEAATQLASDISISGGSADAAHVDVAQAGACERLFDNLRERGVTADALVNSAGVASRAPFVDLPAAEWHRVIDTNLTGTMTMSQLFVRELRKTGRHGAIVNVTSVMAHFTAPNLTAYAASKGGVAMLTRAMALELAPFGIRVNAVSPGYIQTAMTDRGFSVPRFRAAVLARTPMGRLGTTLDVARVIAFLLSDDAGFVTGQVLPVDGGMTAGDTSLASPSPEELAVGSDSEHQ